MVAIGLKTDEYRRFEGKSIAEIALSLGKDPFDALFDPVSYTHLDVYKRQFRRRAR